MLKDIEAHGPLLKSVIRQHELVARKGANDKSANCVDSPTPPPPTTTAAPPPTNSNDSPTPQLTYTFSAVAGGSALKGAFKVPRKVKALEKRWHQIYLRSLEWHYFLEGTISNFKVITYIFFFFILIFMGCIQSPVSVLYFPVFVCWYTFVY